MYVSSLILKIKGFENQIGNVFWSKVLKLTELNKIFKLRLHMPEGAAH